MSNIVELTRGEDRQRLLDVMTRSHLLMKGPRRVGKSTLLDDLVSRAPAGWHMVRVDLEGASTTEAGVELLEAALRRADLLGPLPYKALGAVRSVTIQGVEVDLSALQPADRLLALVGRALAHLPSGARLGLLFDEVPWWLDEIQQEEGRDHARRALKRLHAIGSNPDYRAKLAIVLAGSVNLRPVASCLDCDDYLRGMEDFELEPLDQHGTSAVFEVEVLPHAISDGAMTRVFELSAGIPEWVKHLAGHLRLGALPDQTPITVDHVDEAAVAYIHSHQPVPFDRERRRHLKLRHGEELAAVMNKMLDVIAQRDGRTPVLGLVAVAMQVSKPPFNESSARALIDHLVRAYYLRIDQGTDEVWFYCPLFGRAWARHGSTP